MRSPPLSRAADPLVADLAVVHRLLGEPLLRDRRRERGRVGDRCRVAPPLDRRRALRVVRPARERVGLAGGVGRVPRERQRPGLARLGPEELRGVRRRGADANRCRPALTLVGRGRVVDGAVVVVDPSGVDVAARVDRQRREQVPRAAAARRDRERDVVELDPRPLAGRHVTDRHAYVVALVAGGVQVAVLRIEAQLAAGRVCRERERRLRGGALPDEPADRVGRACRAGARVDERADGRLVEAHEDRVVGGRGRRAVVDRVPLPVDRDVLDGQRVLPPGVAVVVRDRSAEVDEPFEVDEVVVPLVVDRDVGVTAARRSIRAQADRAVDVELEPVVGRAVDPRVLGGGAERAALPVVVGLRVEEVQRLALGALRVDHGRRAERQLARDIGGGRRAAVAAGPRAGSRLDLGHRDVARGVRAGVGVGRRDHAARERADLDVPRAGLQVRALVADRLGTGRAVAVDLQHAARVVQLELDVVGRDGHGRRGDDGRVARGDVDRLQRAAVGRRDAAGEGAGIGRRRSGRNEKGGQQPGEGEKSQSHERS